jgi:hypothetical protein
LIHRPFLSQEQRMKGGGRLGPLNGVGANTPSGLLHQRSSDIGYVKPFIGSYACICSKKESINTNITPSEGSRIESLEYGCYSPMGNSIGVTQSRVKELLQRAKDGLNFGNEGTRIGRVQDMNKACSEDSLLKRQIIVQQCPPMPPPPAPPSRVCPPTKNQK